MAKQKRVQCVLLAALLTVFMGLVFPLALGWLLDGEWSLFFGIVTVIMLCLGWPGYALWLSLWACRDIMCRWFLPPLFAILLACTCGAWAGRWWPIGLFAAIAMLVVSVIVMTVTVSSRGNKNE